MHKTKNFNKSAVLGLLRPFGLTLILLERQTIQQSHQRTINSCVDKTREFIVVLGSNPKKSELRTVKPNFYSFTNIKIITLDKQFNKVINEESTAALTKLENSF